LALACGGATGSFDRPGMGVALTVLGCPLWARSGHSTLPPDLRAAGFDGIPQIVRVKSASSEIIGARQRNRESDPSPIAFYGVAARISIISQPRRSDLKRCTAEAKEKKIRWPASRKYVSYCVAKAVKLTLAEIEKIAVKQATVACKAQAKGKKIRWPASRKYVKNCITTALKEHPTMNISEVRRGVNVKTLRVHQRPEWGCEGMTSGRATGC